MLVKVIGIIVTAAGVIFLVRPLALKKYIAYLKQERRIYLVGILRVLLGALFLWVAPQCKLSAVMNVLGVLTLIGAVLIFILGLERVKKVLDWYDKKPVSVLRLLALIAIAIGVLIIYSV